jgi:hypothetical protein
MRNLLFYCLFLMFQPFAYSQPPNWSQITPKIFELLHSEIKDSISSNRKSADFIRNELNHIVNQTRLDRVMVFGEADLYLKEGMHKHFKAEPSPLQLQVTDRDPRMVLFETQHFELYKVDKSLFRWIEIEKKVNQYEKDWTQYTFANKFDAMSPLQRSTIQSKQSFVIWGATEIVCKVTGDLEMKEPLNQESKMNAFKPEINVTILEKMDQKEPLTFPIPTEKILASFPTNGQYAFCRDEARPGVGYMFFTGGLYQVSSLKYDNNSKLRAKWSSADGKVFYTSAAIENNFQLKYILPDNFFQPATLYKLDIIVMTGQASALIDAYSDVCWATYRQNAISTNYETLIKPFEEKIVTSIYFRSSKYSTLMDRLMTMKGEFDMKTGNINCETDEPLEYLETKGGLNFESVVEFSFSGSGIDALKNNLTDRTLTYYLVVPKVENLSKFGLNELSIAEQDNTSATEFIRKVTKDDAENYINLKDLLTIKLAKSSGYPIPKISEGVSKDTAINSKNVPFITIEDFKKGKKMNMGKVKSTLVIGEINQLAQAMLVYRTQIEKRMEERAQFFYQLDLRRNKRDNTPMSGNLDFYKQQEKNNLPAAGKYILSTDIKDFLGVGLTIYCSRTFPGTTQKSAILNFKF